MNGTHVERGSGPRGGDATSAARRVYARPGLSPFGTLADIEGASLEATRLAHEAAPGPLRTDLEALAERWRRILEVARDLASRRS